MNKIKTLVISIMTLALLMFGVLIYDVGAHEINYNHHGGYHHGYRDMGPEYCPGHHRWISDDYDKLLEKQKQEREKFLKDEEAKWHKNVDKGGIQQ